MPYANTILPSALFKIMEKEQVYMQMDHKAYREAARGSHLQPRFIQILCFQFYLLALPSYRTTFLVTVWVLGP
eukprot:c29222_g1_i1 orf=472-690(-)